MKRRCLNCNPEPWCPSCMKQPPACVSCARPATAQLCEDCAGLREADYDDALRRRGGGPFSAVELVVMRRVAMELVADGASMDDAVWAAVNGAKVYRGGR